MILYINVRCLEKDIELFNFGFDTSSKALHMVGKMYPADLRFFADLQTLLEKYKDRYNKHKDYPKDDKDQQKND